MVARVLRRWRIALLPIVLLCFLALTTAEAWHHDKGGVPDPQCALCQVAAHQPLDLEPPPPTLPVAFLLVLYVLTPWQPRARIFFRPLAAYHSRAPPQAS